MVLSADWEGWLKGLTDNLKGVLDTSDSKKNKNIKSIEYSEKNKKVSDLKKDKIFKDPKIFVARSEIENKFYSTQISAYAAIPQKRRQRWDRVFLQDLQRYVLESENDFAQVQNWYSRLAQGGSREGIYNSLVFNQDYLKKYDGFVLGQNMVIAIRFFLKTYLKKDVEISKDYNFNWLKREIVDLALTRLDTSLHKPKSLYNWYATLSQFIAKKLNQGKKDQPNIRLIAKYENHFEWASQVPPDLIRTEIMIKIHLYLNHLKNTSAIRKKADQS
jgi:hypothetical protein